MKRQNSFLRHLRAQRPDIRIRLSGTLCRIGLVSGMFLLVTLPACQSETSDSGGDGDGDGDVTGDGDFSGDGDMEGDGDGDVPGDGDGDMSGDGDGDGDIIGDGDGDGDIIGDGDGDTGPGGSPGDGDGDVSGDGDGDGVTCTAEYVYGLHVRVVGGAGLSVAEGAAPPMEIPIILPPSDCAATVIAVDGDYSEILTCSQSFIDPNDCQCYGAGEREGIYRVTATLGGQMETQTVEVVGDECHVQQQNLTFFEVVLE